MSLQAEQAALLKRLKRDCRADAKAQAKRMRIPYQTMRSLIGQESIGSLRTWLKIERWYQKRDAEKAA